jgi:hypothetical protein
VENIFTTDDELYKAFSENPASELQGPTKDILNYRKALWMGYDHLKQHDFDENYFVKMYRIVSQFSKVS